MSQQHSDCSVSVPFIREYGADSIINRYRPAPDGPDLAKLAPGGKPLNGVGVLRAHRRPEPSRRPPSSNHLRHHLPIIATPHRQHAATIDALPDAQASSCPAAHDRVAPPPRAFALLAAGIDTSVTRSVGARASTRTVACTSPRTGRRSRAFGNMPDGTSRAGWHWHCSVVYVVTTI